MENRQKEIFVSKMPDQIKGEVFRENQREDNKLAYGEQITNFIVWLSLT
jgi:hypothetical protein